MKYIIKNTTTLKKILWLDFALGFLTSITGLIFYSFFSSLFNLNETFIIVISLITFLYACFAFILAKQKLPSIRPLRVLIKANFIWTFISIFLLYYHFNNASVLGKCYLFLQIMVVGLLALLEKNQLKKINK
jgi:amino acid transporter